MISYKIHKLVQTRGTFEPFNKKTHFRQPCVLILLKRGTKVHLWLRSTYICAQAWIFFNLCIFITQHIQAMKIYLLNEIIKNRAQEATLTYSHIVVIPVSKFLCPKCINLFISMVCQNQIDSRTPQTLYSCSMTDAFFFDLC